MTINFPAPLTVGALIEHLKAYNPATEVRTYYGGSITRHLTLDYYKLGDGCTHIGCEHGHPYVLIDGDYPTITVENDQ